MPDPTPEPISTEPNTSKRWIIPFIAVVFAMMAMQMSRLGFSPLLPDIQHDFGINYSQVGLFSGVYGLAAIVCSIPGGILAKRFGEKNVLTIGLVVVALGLTLLSFAPSFGFALSARVVWITGYRVAFVCVMTAVAVVVPAAYRSTAMGILGGMSSLASVIGAPFGIAIGLAFGWRNGILAFGGMALLGAIVFWIFYHAPKAAELRPPAAGHGIAAAPDASAFSNPLVWSMVLLGLTNMGGFSANFFVPSAVKSTFGLGPTVAAYIMSAAYVTAIFANILTGYLADRSNRWAVMIGIMLLLIPSCFAMMSTSLIVFRVATALVISLGLCATNQIFAIAGEVMPGREMGPVMGIVSLGGGIFGYIGPQTLGILRDRTGGYTAGWYFVAFGALIGLVVILILKRAAGKPELPQMQVAPNA
jgi:predicted MFS family arabinose efflux permease